MGEREKYYIGVDVGGTKLAAGLVDQKKMLVTQCEMQTKTGTARELALQVKKLVLELLHTRSILEEQILSMGIGVPGSVDAQTGKILYANNLGIQNEDFGGFLKELFLFPIKVENDANCAAWGEYKAGSGQDAQSMIMVTLGTGVGGGIIWKDQLIGGCNGAAGEIGHMVIDLNGAVCNCGRRGCFEQYASTTALLELAADAMQQHPESVLWNLCKGTTTLLSGKLFFEALESGDTAAKEAYDIYLNYLSIGICNLINIFQPEILCVGGGISKVGDRLLEPLKERVAGHVYSRESDRQTQIKIANLYNEAGIIGAALL